MAQFSLTTVSNLFKTKFGKLSENTYNSANVLLGRVKKEYDFTGKQLFVPVPLSFSGGVGAGSLPTANYSSVDDALINAEKVYAVTQVDRESLKASADDEGAFVRLLKFTVQKAVESYMRNASRILYGDGTGVLGQFSGNAAGTATDPILTILNTGTYSWNEANFEDKDYINVNSLSSVWEIVSVDPSTRAVTLSRISGADDLTAIGAGTHSVYMQNSKNEEPVGLLGTVEASAGSVYSIPVARRWKGYQKDANAAGLITDLMNEVMLGVQKQSGKVPNLITTSFTQYRKLLNILEDQKEYSLDARAADLKGHVSFRGVEFMSSAGPVGVFPDRFCPENKMYFLNDNFITLHHRPDFGWFDDDGTVFLRESSSDAYGARYGGYWQTFIPPSFHGVLSDLAV